MLLFSNLPLKKPKKNPESHRLFVQTKCTFHCFGSYLGDGRQEMMGQRPESYGLIQSWVNM